MDSVGADNASLAQRSVITSTLPVETMTHILAYLPVKRLREASRVSRLFYSCARASGLYIGRTIYIGDPRAHHQLAVFNEIIEHAIAQDYPLHLYVVSCSLPRSWTRYDGAHQLRTAGSAIASALPVLASLTLCFKDANYDLTEPLRLPMPRLKELNIHTASRVPLPTHHFAGDAPMLRKVELSNLVLAGGPAPAFSNVTSLCIIEGLHFDEDEEVKFACTEHFPSLSRLELKASESCELGNDLSIDLEGVVLRSLIIDDIIPLPAVKQALAFDQIPVVCIRCCPIQIWIEPEHDDTDFSVRLMNALQPYPGDDGMLAGVIPSHRLWKRIYDIPDWQPDIRLPLVEKRGAVEYLTYLRLENTYLHDFLSCDVAFHALVRIQIDLRSSSAYPTLLWPPDAPLPNQSLYLNFDTEDRTADDFNKPSLYEVPCTVLETLTVFALDERTTVQPREAAFLGRALGQLGRPKCEKAALVLAGVDFAQPLESPLLDLTFSQVKRAAFSGWNSQEDYDGGLWEDIASIIHIGDWD